MRPPAATVQADNAGRGELDGSSGTAAPTPRGGGLSGGTFLGKRGRGSIGGGDGDDSNSISSRGTCPGDQQRRRQDDRGKQSSLSPPRSPPSPTVSPKYGGPDQKKAGAAGDGSISGGSSSGGAGAASSAKSMAWSKSSLGNPDMAAVLRRWASLAFNFFSVMCADVFILNIRIITPRQPTDS